MHMHVKVDLHFFGKEAFICVSEKNDKLLSRLLLNTYLINKLQKLQKEYFENMWNI